MTSSGEIPEVRVIPLGGVGEIGVNCTVFECGDTRIVVDCGIMFPRETMFGVDVIAPDLTYLRDAGHVDAVILTHGHEDHIGALGNLLELYDVPVYGTRFTLGLARERFGKVGDFRVTEPRAPFTIGAIEIEFLQVTHSIVDACGLALTTAAGTIIHTGDFKIDATPPTGDRFDFDRFADYGRRGVLLLMSDSTNAEFNGHSLSEAQIRNRLSDLFTATAHEQRLFVSMFASHIARIRQVLQLSAEHGRRVVLDGRRMKGNIAIARETGHLKVPDGLLTEANNDDEHVTVLCTGSQAEPGSSLSKIVSGVHSTYRLRDTDRVVLSSKLIPGNENAVGAMLNDICDSGAEVIYEAVSEIHASGHAYADELRTMLALVRPQHFMPIHGEPRMLTAHAALAVECGVPADKVFSIRNGQVLACRADHVQAIARVQTGRVGLDGLEDRQRMAERGVVIAVLIEGRDPVLTSRGLPREVVESAVDVLRALNEVTTEEVVRVLNRYFRKRLARRPLIVPVIE